MEVGVCVYVRGKLRNFIKPGDLRRSGVLEPCENR